MKSACIWYAHMIAFGLNVSTLISVRYATGFRNFLSRPACRLLTEQWHEFGGWTGSHGTARRGGQRLRLPPPVRKDMRWTASRATSPAQ